MDDAGDAAAATLKQRAEGGGGGRGGGGKGGWSSPNVAACGQVLAPVAAEEGDGGWRRSLVF